MTEVVLVFSKLKDVFNRGVPGKVVTTNFLFRTYVTLTPTLLFLSSILVFTQQLLGNHIKCLKPSNSDIRTSVINQYCFITGTYTVPSLYGSSSAAHVGVGEYIPKSSTYQTHNYYQWVPFVLFVQAMIFHLPNLMWRSVEKSRIQNYCSYYSNQKPNEDESTASNTTPSARMPNPAAHQFYSSLGYNWLYVPCYFLLELLNLIILAMVCILTDRFLNGNFQNYGMQWIRYIQHKLPFVQNPYLEASIPEDQLSPMDKIFPKVSKCSFKTFGPSGRIVNHDIMCVLTLNVIHEKLFLLLWFWCGLLFLLSCVNVLYRFVLMIYPSARRQLVLKRIIKDEDKTKFKLLWKSLKFSDWFILKRLSNNMDQFVFSEFISDVYDILLSNSDHDHYYKGHDTFDGVIKPDSSLTSEPSSLPDGIKYRKVNSLTNNKSLQHQPSKEEIEAHQHQFLFRKSSAPMLITNKVPKTHEEVPQTPTHCLVAAQLERHNTNKEEHHDEYENLLQLNESYNKSSQLYKQ